MKYIKVFTLLTLTVLLFNGFWSGKTDSEKREERVKIMNQTLNDLYSYAPESKELINKAYGYAVFSNVGINLILLSAEGGVGVAHDSRLNKKIYMNMASGGFGFGLGVKDFRAVFIFENKKVFYDFVNLGWEANAQADAAAKAGDKGGTLNGAITVAPGIRLYKMTKNGLALQATIQGTKYWKDSDLN